jgi:hypothetical protein
MNIELVYDTACPNLGAARGVLRSVLKELGLQAEWIEKEQPLDSSVATRYSSPTILVDGKDVVADAAPQAAGCRIYRDGEDNPSGVPPAGAVMLAVQTALE